MPLFAKPESGRVALLLQQASETEKVALPVTPLPWTI
jgi:hypothetical protein